MEFAVDMTSKPMKFGFLQIRPITSREEFEDIDLTDVDPGEAICFSAQALGNGQMCGIHDIIYIKPTAFDAGMTREIAAELAKMNHDLARADRSCVLIGPGRWGSSDRWLGIPVTWDQISSAQVIVETTLQDFVIAPSQGTHFFQNLTSLGIGYMTVDPSIDQGSIDWDWLAGQDAAEETRFLRRIAFDEELDVRLDGRTRRGMVFKPGAAG